MREGKYDWVQIWEKTNMNEYKYERVHNIDRKFTDQMVQHVLFNSTFLILTLQFNISICLKYISLYLNNINKYLNWREDETGIKHDICTQYLIHFYV